MRCKVCTTKFVPRFFLEKTCSKECAKIFSKTNTPKYIAKKSEKQIKNEAKYKVARVDYLYKHHVCERCYKKATEIHHKNSRNGNRLFDETYFMAVCRSCHTYIHENPIISREEGWLN